METLRLLLPYILPIAMPFVLYLAWQAVSVMQRNGHRTTYAAAVLKAVGEGQNAAQDRGLSIFTKTGRVVAAQAGADYLEAKVSTAAAKLGIVGIQEHKDRVMTQIGLMAAEAEATVETTARIAANAAVATRTVLSPRVGREDVGP